MLHNLATIGFVREVPELAVEYEHLKELLDSEDIYKKQSEKSLQRYKEIWSIEDRWRKEAQIKSDLFFMGLLTLHLAGFIEQ